MKLKNIAAELGVSDAQVRKWKNQDQWEQKVTLPNTKGNVTNGKSNVTDRSEIDEIELFPGQCEAIGHKSGKRCTKKALPGERFCSYHMDGHRENQCTATSKQTGERCRKLAEPGKKVCKFHGGKSTGPVGHQNHMKHGLFARFIPEDDVETIEFMEEIENMSPLDILWQNIKFLFAVIARSAKIAWVKDQQDMTKVLKRTRSKETAQTTEEETEWEIQHAWDKHNSYMATLAKAQKTLESKIMSYEELIEKYEKRGYVVEEHRLRVEKLKAEINKITTGEDDKPIEVIIKRKGEG